jgi:diguanylate cyclase (GGDEF)-like protein/PAS domain S-box-containing protein
MERDASPAQIDQDAILRQQLGNRQLKQQKERAAVLRVYNYYRIVLSFLLIIVFYEIPDQSFVGALAPDWFQSIILSYLVLNVASGFLVLIKDGDWITNDSTVATFVIVDIFFLSALLLTSGGVESGLGYLLVFSVAFGGIMLRGQFSVLLAAIATVTGISAEYYLHNMGSLSGNQHYFEMAMLGVAFFLVDFSFQYFSKLIADRDKEVVSLEALDTLHRIAEQSRNELEISNARFTVLLQSTGEGVIGLDMNGHVTFANPSACQLLNIDYDELMHGDIQRFMIAADTDTEQDKVVSIRPQKILELLGIPAKATYDPGRWQTFDGDSFIIEYSCEATVNKAGARTGAVLLFQNITQQRENEERVEYLANFDELTGLANRTNFTGQFRSAISRNARSDRHIAILVIDTDHFSVINEKLGQEAGDQMLMMLAQRLKNLVRPGDMVARLHGDQFALMLVDLDHAENAALVADKVLKHAAEPIQLDSGTPITTSVSVGIAVTNNEERDSDEMISAAISAMDNAKTHGRNTYRFFHPDMQKKAEEKKRVQMMLRSAIENNEFKLVYQPIINLKNQKIQSAEALIRWMPPGADPIRPDIFIPIAEESGQINNIGAWVLDTVIGQVKSWQEQLGICPAVAINVSSKQLKNHEFREQFQTQMRSHNLPVGGVELELTETGVMEDPEKSLEELIKLHELGVSISIDDFGTGYSSLDYLRRLPLDILKIDQSFTFGIGESENDEEIVRVMIRMAHAMGLKVICEGVETREHLEFLQAHDCDYVQGYYFSRPRSVADMTELLAGELDGSINIMDLAGTG